jgi:hypothetical protein
MGWMPTDTKTRYAMGLPTLEESLTLEKNQRAAADANAREATQGELERRQGLVQTGIESLRGETARSVAATQAAATIEAARLQAEARRRAGYAEGGAVKDPRASRRMYAKGGPVFR